MGTPLTLATTIPSVLVRGQAASSPATDEDMLPFAPINAIRLGRIEEGQACGPADGSVDLSRKAVNA
jgi:hypothetical protein